jgi:hypothetical protein
MDKGLLEWVKKCKQKAGKGFGGFGDLTGMGFSVTSDQKVTRAILSGSVSGVRDSLTKAFMREGLTPLVRENIAHLNQANSKVRLEILNLLLVKGKESSFCILEPSLLELALESGFPEHFFRIAEELKSNNSRIPDLFISTKKVVSKGDKSMWDALLEGGFYKKEWGDELLHTAFTTKNQFFVDTFLSLGADPSYGKTDWTLKSLQDSMKRGDSVDIDNMVNYLIKNYKKTDLQRVIKDKNNNWSPRIKELCQSQLDVIGKSRKTKITKVTSRDFV